ncbi:hypothetical protein ACFPVT_02715 [Corynebacterium choanae]|uniref:Secreted protein n=1 Tax=Corynebacterium choanae TaxID=1862358 RepID=A0A3G6J547_9CORY|nr:hypothetical protein [Corynebacterium choanae]AZA12992.1 hypothetical protein CCHOA_02880 [Corynebacterium choanae]
MRTFGSVKKALVISAMAVPLVLTACGSDDEAATTTTASSTSTTTSTETKSKDKDKTTKSEKTSTADKDDDVTVTETATETATETLSPEEQEQYSEELKQQIEAAKAAVKTVENGAPADQALVDELLELERNVNSLDPNVDIREYFCAADREAPETQQVLESRVLLLNAIRNTGQEIPAPEIELNDVKVDGDVASGTVTVSVNQPNSYPVSTPQAFKKEDGKWRVCTLK